MTADSMPAEVAPETLPTDRPRWRGRIHMFAAAISVPLGFLLVALADSMKEKIGAMVFGISLSGLFTVSGTYHSFTWRPEIRSRMRRLDHSMIYVLIAGTYTPFALLMLSPPWNVRLTIAAWIGAIAGTILKVVALERLKVLGLTSYLVLGWMVLPAIPSMADTLGTAPLVLLLVGGIVYTVGAVMFALRKPKLSPKVFGYHELWHAFVAAAAGCHWTALVFILK